MIPKLMNSQNIGQQNVEYKNANLIYASEILDMRLFVFNELGEWWNNGDYNTIYNIKVDGPLNRIENLLKIIK